MTDYDIEVFYDGDCPFCMREIRSLGHLDKHDRIRFVDIAAENFDAASAGVSREVVEGVVANSAFSLDTGSSARSHQFC